MIAAADRAIVVRPALWRATRARLIDEIRVFLRALGGQRARTPQ